MVTARELITLQADALFTYDASGRMLRTNDPDSTPAPRVFLGRTREGNVLRVRHDISDDLAGRLAPLACAEPVDADLEQPPVGASRIRALFGEESPPFGGSAGGPAFRFPEVLATPSTAVRLSESNAYLLTEFAWLPGALWEWRPCLASIEDGQAVSICFSSRRSDRVAEAGVETLPRYRGRGHATNAVSAWAQAIRDEGLIPLYSTSWDNLASRSVARRLGLVQYGADWSLP